LKNLKTLERLQQLHQRVKNENTGTPIAIAKYMNISERSVYTLIDELKILGAEVCYSRTRKTYYYCNDFNIELKISLKVITEDTARNLYGGSYFLKENSFTARFLQGTKLCLKH